MLSRISFVILFLLPLTAHAIQAPWYVDQIKLGEMEYADKHRKQSPEAVVLFVYRSEVEHIVQPDECWRLQNWKLFASVLSVKRSMSGIKTGDRVQVQYTVKNMVCPGGAYFSLQGIDPGRVTSAYLLCEALQCGPTAGAWSFDEDDNFAATLKEVKQKVEEWHKKGMYSK